MDRSSSMSDSRLSEAKCLRHSVLPTLRRIRLTFRLVRSRPVRIFLVGVLGLFLITFAPLVRAEENTESVEIRDAVGDLNGRSIDAGSFPGSIELPGPGGVSLGIGGFIKAALIYDDEAETQGADFLPALLGTREKDDDGQTAIDATLSRMFFDARSTSELGSARGYIEFDFNGSNNGDPEFKLRHAYGTWDTKWGGRLTAGHTWTAAMDTRALPEGLTEPTVSGAIFQRQAQLRWTQPLFEGATAEISIEDPNNDDVFDVNDRPGRSRIPDFIGALQYVRPGVGHVRLTGVARFLEIDQANQSKKRETGWGLTLSGTVNTIGEDRFIASATYGEAMGRYLLGLAPTAGAVVDPASGSVKARSNHGGYVAYQRYWNDVFRSSFAVGFARSAPKKGQPGTAFENSTYAYGNLVWQVMRYVSIGVEYDWGRREDKSGSSIQNHRVLLAFQIF